ncbi:hypothetical protein L5515_006965 [Caenorhabditis briggsae]|uniref:Uncharacterized protein n=2 Tax=Caenorhabditis briggsae TaxID=6238 RepID=A0AAE8ZZ16_CAEBR|nr:hypothetical protein L3Y34_007123 [Caenorhabditis briggsae]UMM33515.1 hypothetical protein L5515_006965 [Caenorhabditis briggsae]
MANRGANGCPPIGLNVNFERNKYRQTMPNAFRPPNTPDHRNKRFQDNSSPTQSFVSTATTYEQPWSSPQFKPPQEPRFRRTNSMAVKKKEEVEQQRPKINFMELGKKITNKFKKNQKNDKKAAGGSADNRDSRLSAPIIKLGEGSTSSASSLPATTSSPTKIIKPTTSVKMQPEDRMKMFQKMGREQAMKVSNVQRMQRERQRDFSLVPGPGKACLLGSNQSIDSVFVCNNSPDSRRSTSLSMTDDDVEPVFRNAMTNKKVTSAQFNKLSNENSSGPSFTSTPRLVGSTGLQADSPTISHVRSASEASYCMMTSSEHPTMYYSADTLNNSQHIRHFMPPRSDVSLASTASTPTAPDPTPPLKKVKQEIEESSNPTPPPTAEQFRNNSAPPNCQPQHLNTLWMVSKDIRENQLQLERAVPRMESMRNRAIAIDQQRVVLLNEKGDKPSDEDLRRLWSLDRELLHVNNEMSMASMAIQNANNVLPYLEMRRNELLAGSPPPPPLQAGSFV